MQKKIQFKWEMIDDSNEGKFQTLRAKVIGGWIVKTIFQDMKLKLLTVTSEFIADRDHEWVIIQPIVETETLKADKSADFEPK